MREIELPDGKIAEFDDNTPDEVLHSFARDYIDKNLGKGEAPAQEEQRFLEKAGNLAKGVPQGLGDAVIGLVQTGGEMGTSAIRGLERKIYGDNFYDENSKENFNVRLADQIKQLKERQSQLPTSERGGIMGGRIAADIALSPIKGLGRVAQAIGTGAVSGLTAPLEESGTNGRLKEIATNATLGGVLGKGSELVSPAFNVAKEGAKNIISGIRAKLPEELRSVEEGIKNKSRALYQAVRDSGTMLRPQATGQIVKRLEKSLTKDGEPVAEHLHGDTMKTIQFIKDDIAEKGNQISLPELDQYRQLLNQTIKKNTTKLEGANPDAVKSIAAKGELDNIVDKLSPNYLVKSGNPKAIELLKQATKEWSRGKKFERITDIAERAEGDPNKIKNLVKNFVLNKNNLKGYSPQEIQALKAAAKSSTGEKAMKMLGGFGIDANNKLLPSIGGIGAFMAGGPMGSGATIAAGTAARQTQKYLARGKLDEALKIIQSSNNPAQVISKIPDRKAQEQILNHFLKAATAGMSELNNQ